MLLVAAETAPNPWAFQAHPEVWLLVGSVFALGLYVARVIAPKVPASVVGDGPAITRRQKGWFLGGVAVLWIASDWPMHDIAEEHLYALHMFQHFLLTLVVPPMFWLATPSWLARLVVAPGTKAWASLRRLANPIVATVIFSTMTIATHWTVVVNTSIEIGPVHYLVHLIVVTASRVNETSSPDPSVTFAPSVSSAVLPCSAISTSMPFSSNQSCRSSSSAFAS